MPEKEAELRWYIHKNITGPKARTHAKVLANLAGMEQSSIYMQTNPTPTKNNYRPMALNLLDAYIEETGDFTPVNMWLKTFDHAVVPITGGSSDPVAVVRDALAISKLEGELSDVVQQITDADSPGGADVTDTERQQLNAKLATLATKALEALKPKERKE